MAGIGKDDLQRLFADFPRESVHWRAQSVTKEGDKAMALAYIDARDVMDRLDLIVGTQNWQDSYQETAKGRLICTLSINVEGEWISKSDGAGDTDVEGSKGAISDAFKRAAVKWGVGRYLYDMPTPWVPCESYEKNGKRHWKKWKSDPWQFVNRPIPVEDTKCISDGQRDLIATTATAAGVTLLAICEAAKIDDLRDLPADQFDSVMKKLSLTIERKAKPKERQAA